MASATPFGSGSQKRNASLFLKFPYLKILCCVIITGTPKAHASITLIGITDSVTCVVRLGRTSISKDAKYYNAFSCGIKPVIS